MKCFNLFAMIALLCVNGHSYGMSYAKAALLCLAHGIGISSFVESHQKPNQLIFFSKESALKECLEKSEQLRSHEYHQSITPQSIIQQTASFLALQKLSSVEVDRAITNIVLTELLQKAFSQQDAPVTDAVLNSTYNNALTLASHVTTAAVSCRTTRFNYRQQKKRQRQLNQRDWTHD